MTAHHPSPVRARLTGAAAASALTALVAGIPTLLLTIGATPIPDRGFTWQQLTAPDDGALALSAVTVVAWLAWALLTVLVGLDVTSRLRDTPCPRLPGLATPQALAHGLVGAALLLLTPTAAPPASPPDSSAVTVTLTDRSFATPTPHQPAAADTASTRGRDEETHTVRAGESLWSIAQDELGHGERWRELADRNDGHYGPDHTIYAGTVLHLPPPVPDGSTYTVRRGDTLSGIAQDHFGDPDRYPEIFTASRRTTQPDGRHLTDPDLIVTGWHLTLPTPSAAPVEPRPAATKPEVGPQERPAPLQQAPTRPALRDVKPAPERPSSPSPAGTATNDAAADRDSIDAPWVLTGLTGGGLLVGGLWIALRRRRAAQFRHRRPGRTPATPDPSLAPVEKTLAAFGPSTVPDLEQLDLALRHLARHLTNTGHPLPALAAIELTPAGITAHLEAPADLPAPWRDLGGRTRWLQPTGHETLPEDHDGELDQPAPYPLLVTLGTSDTGAPWLFNCEDLAVTLTGDPTYAQDYARYLAAEIACNPWSAGVTLDCVGLAAEVSAMNPDRLRAHPAGSDAAAEVLADAVATIDRATDHAGDAVTARAAQAGADAWPARMLLLDPATATTPALTQLLDLLTAHPGSTATGVVLTGHAPHAGSVGIEFTASGRVRLPHAGLDLVAVGLTLDEAAGCTALLAAGADLDDQPMPTTDHDDGWRAFTDAAGALRPEHTEARDPHPTDGADDASLLERPDEDYLHTGATTPADLAALAPHIPATVHPDLAAADPTLDAELAAWHAEDCPLPRLTLLGPVKARTRGRALTERKAYMTAVLAYLATRPHGATPDELADAMGITPAKARGYAKIVRDWLGPNPRTGTTHLPDARHAPSALARGVPVYEVQDLLVDADLFRRLRARGQTRGSDGIPDLVSALNLVTGRPFDQLRPGAWAWLYDGDRLDQHLLCAVVDVAHIVTTHALQSGDTETARKACELAATAAPEEDRPFLDLAAVVVAEGRSDEVQTVLRDHVLNREDDETTAPVDLPPRSEQVIRNRRWTGDQAAS